MASPALRIEVVFLTSCFKNLFWCLPGSVSQSVTKHSTYQPIRIEPFLGEASHWSANQSIKADREWELRATTRLLTSCFENLFWCLPGSLTHKTFNLSTNQNSTIFSSPLIGWWLRAERFRERFMIRKGLNNKGKLISCSIYNFYSDLTIYCDHPTQMA